MLISSFGLSASSPINVLVKTSLVNWLPWSVLNISGLPCSRKASSAISAHHSASIVLLKPHPIIRRLNTSMMAARYINPFRIGIYVISISHTWFGWSMVNPRSKYGYFLCSGAETVVLGCGKSASMRIKCIKRRTRFFPT